MAIEGWLQISEDVFVVADSSMVRSAYETWVKQYHDGVWPDNSIRYGQFEARTAIVFKRVVIAGIVSDIVAASFEMPKNLCTVQGFSYRTDCEQVRDFLGIFNYVRLAPGLYIINSPEVLNFTYADWLTHQRPPVNARDLKVIDLDGVTYPLMVSISLFGGEHQVQTSHIEAAQISPGVYRIMSQQGLYQAYQHFAFGKPSVDPLPDGMGSDYAYPGIIDFSPDTRVIARWLPTQ